MLRPTMDTLSSHEVGARLVPPDPPNGGTFARRAPARSAGLAAPVAGAAAHATATSAAREDRPMALGRARPHLDRVANGACRRQAGDRHRLAPTGLPAVVDLEEPPPHGATDRPSRRPYAHSHDVAGNPRWGAPRIHGELRKLGIDVCETTVAKYMVRPRQPSSQTWRTFLRNHLGQIVAADFFVVPTATYRLLFVLVLLAHDRRRIRHVAVTAHPTAAWTAQQLREAFPWDEAPRYLIHDRDHAFDGLGTTAKAMGIDDVLTAPHAPWQNPFVERFIGSARRECFDHVIVFNEAGLQRLMTLYCSYHERSRTHLSLDKDTPIPRRVMPPGEGTVVAIPEVGGLHYRYERRAA